MFNKFPIFYHLIDPITGRRPLEEGFIFVGNKNNIEEPVLLQSLLLNVRDLQSKLSLLAYKFEYIANSRLLLPEKNKYLNHAQALNKLSDSLLRHTNGVVKEAIPGVHYVDYKDFKDEVVCGVQSDICDNNNKWIKPSKIKISDINQTIEETTNIKQEIKNVQEITNQNTININNNTTNINNITNKTEQINNNIKNIQEVINNTTNEIKNIQETINNIKYENNNNQEIINNITNETKNIQEVINNITNEITDNTKTINNIENNIKNTQENINNMQETINNEYNNNMEFKNTINTTLQNNINLINNVIAQITILGGVVDGLVAIVETLQNNPNTNDCIAWAMGNDNLDIEWA